MPIIYDGQQYLIETMALLKEEIGIVYENNKGICHGLSMMALQAFLCGELQEFNQRIDDIHEMYQEKKNIKEELKRIQQQIARRTIKLKIGKNLVLTHEEQKIIDIWAFFDGIALYQKPKKHDKIFGKTLNQHQSIKVAPFVNSAVLEQQGGLAKIGTCNGIYNLAELRSYLNILTTTAKNCNQDIAIHLHTTSRPNNHAISLCWDNTKKKWFFIDANELPIQEFSDKDMNTLAAKIFATFWDKSITAFESILYATGNNKVQTQKFLRQLRSSKTFKRIHESSTANKAELKAWDLINQACIAAKEGNANELREAIKNGVELNKSDLYYNKTSLNLMTNSTKPEILELLASTCEDPAKLSSVLTLITKKKMRKQVKIVDLLIRQFTKKSSCNIQLNRVYEFIAASQKPALLHLLIKYKVNLRENNINGTSLLSIILASGQSGFYRYYQLTSDVKNKASRKKRAASLKNYKSDIDNYLNSLDEKDRNEANAVLQQIEDKIHLRKFSLFSRKKIPSHSHDRNAEITLINSICYVS